MVPVPAFIELFGGLSHELVQLIQVDICEYGRNDAALRTAGVGSMVLPVLHITGFQEFPDELNQPSIFNLGVYDVC